ncbi:hypothetical protein BV898_03473 [Hypsibius exemplaris]|uniref:MARVEL domain-containing protein n=1 Tax=Hypsibius exemplaris TaxID=2072580 RepID=A0A1W0X5G8_HYPEX|nr:hypothetical protein BV898_03473 [Hypsibius exemplaris]
MFLDRNGSSLGIGRLPSAGGHDRQNRMAHRVFPGRRSLFPVRLRCRSDVSVRAVDHIRMERRFQCPHPKTTYFEMVINFLLGLFWLTAGIVELAITCREGWNGQYSRFDVNNRLIDDQGRLLDANTLQVIATATPSTLVGSRIVYAVPNMLYQDWGCRIAAGSLALFLGVFHLVSFALAVLAAIGIGLIGSRREERRLGEPHSVPGTTQIVIEATSFPREMFLPGEVYYLCAHSVAMAVLLVVVMTYFTHTVSSMLVPKGTALEMKMNTALALVLLIAGIVEIVQTEQWKMNESGQSLMTGNEYAVRIAGGVVALLNGVLCIISFVLSYLELRGPKTD